MLDSPNPDWSYKKVESFPYTNDTTATASVNTEKFDWNAKTVRINGEETKSNRLNEISGLADRVKSITDRLDAAKKIETDPKKKESINVLIKKITLRFIYIENMRKAGLDDLPFDTNADGKIDEAYSEISFIVLNEQKAILENLLTEATALLDNKVESTSRIPFDNIDSESEETLKENEKIQALLDKFLDKISANFINMTYVGDWEPQITNTYEYILDEADKGSISFRDFEKKLDYVSKGVDAYIKWRDNKSAPRNRSETQGDVRIKRLEDQISQLTKLVESFTVNGPKPQLKPSKDTVPNVVDNSGSLDSRVVGILKGRELPRDMIDDYQFLMQNRYDANGKEKDEFLPEFNFFLSELTRKLGDIKAYSSKPMGVVPGDETVRSEPLDETLLSSPVIDTPSLDDTVPTSYNLEEEKMVKDEIMKDFDDQKSQLQRVPFTTMLARSESLRNKYKQLLNERDFMTVREFKEAVYKLLGEIKLVDRMAPPVPGANQVIPNPKPFDTDMPVPISKTPLS